MFLSLKLDRSNYGKTKDNCLVPRPRSRGTASVLASVSHLVPWSQRQTQKLFHESLPVYFRASPGSHAELPILRSYCNCQNIDGIHDSMDYR